MGGILAYELTPRPQLAFKEQKLQGEGLTSTRTRPRRMLWLFVFAAATWGREEGGGAREGVCLPKVTGKEGRSL